MHTCMCVCVGYGVICCSQKCLLHFCSAAHHKIINVYWGFSRSQRWDRNSYGSDEHVHISSQPSTCRQSHKTIKRKREREWERERRKEWKRKVLWQQKEKVKEEMDLILRPPRRREHGAAHTNLVVWRWALDHDGPRWLTEC